MQQWGVSNILYQEEMGSPELSIPIQKEQICSVHKTFLLEFQVYKFRITFSVDVESLYFCCHIQKLCVFFHVIFLFLGLYLCGELQTPYLNNRRIEFDH